MTPITVLGASGFIGSALTKRLEESHLEYLAPTRDEKLAGRQLGDVIYCVGLTGDFRSRPIETVQAHVCHLLQVLRDCDFSSLLYLSSTRVYQKQNWLAREEGPVLVNSSDGDDLYNASKVMGEALSLAGGANTRIARISNVYGSDFESQNFIPSILRDAIMKKKVVLQTSLESQRDYIAIDDVIDLLLKISSGGRQRNYNIASGVNVAQRDLMDALSECTGCEVETLPGAPAIVPPVINIDRIREEFDYRPSSLLDGIEGLTKWYRDYYAGRKT
jgi:nucleoside-diphosphate-sugar epimerase